MSYSNMFSILAAIAALTLALNKYKNEKIYDPIDTTKLVDPSITATPSYTNTEQDQFDSLAMQQLTAQSHQLHRDLNSCEEALAKFTGNQMYSTWGASNSIEGMRSIIDDATKRRDKCHDDLNNANLARAEKEQLKYLQNEVLDLNNQLNKCRSSKVSSKVCARNPHTVGCYSTSVLFGYSSEYDDYEGVQRSIASTNDLKANITKQLNECTNSRPSAWSGYGKVARGVK